MAAGVQLLAGRYMRIGDSVTRLGDFLHLGQPFKAGGNT